MRISDTFLDCVIYLYRDPSSAGEGVSAGGSGFLINVQSEAHPEYGYPYAVTNRHVIQDARSRVIRFNTSVGGTEIMETQLEDWTCADADDLAVTRLPFDDQRKQYHIGSDVFMTKAELDNVKIGPGDEAFMVGRFIGHDGKQTNTPAIRFGNISMQPTLVKSESGAEHESFLVEMRSASGYSGSPVFAYINPAEAPFRRLNHEQIRRYGPWLLGVDWGHLNAWSEVSLKNTNERHPDGWAVNANTGMACVSPAWRLVKLLDREELRSERRRLDKKA